jgi:hypothetical protein
LEDINLSLCLFTLNIIGIYKRIEQRPAKITREDHKAAPPHTMELLDPSHAPGVAAITGTATIIAKERRIMSTVISNGIVLVIVSCFNSLSKIQYGYIKL